MDRKVIYSGRIRPGISKSKNCAEIINKINELKIKKEMKEILFLAVMKVFSEDKKNEDILFHLEAFKRNGEIYPNFSSSKYIQNIINQVDLIDKEHFKNHIEELIEYVTINNIEFRYEE